MVWSLSRSTPNQSPVSVTFALSTMPARRPSVAVSTTSTWNSAKQTAHVRGHVLQHKLALIALFMSFYPLQQSRFSCIDGQITLLQLQYTQQSPFFGSSHFPHFWQVYLCSEPAAGIRSSFLKPHCGQVITHSRIIAFS